ncbi:MAG: hypothetical protein M1319_05205 [Chloroflexi bacterium]|nr:hypothetical protein [Chloroflexota bacterium]
MSTRSPHQPDYEKRSLDLINKMRRSAEAATEQLGLPSEAKYDLLDSMYASPANLSLVPALERGAETNPRLYEVIMGFLASYMQNRIKDFQSLWQDLRRAEGLALAPMLALEDVHYCIAAPPDMEEQPRLAMPRLSTRRRSELLGIVDVMTWWLEQEAETGKPVEEKAIVDYATQQGCSPKLARSMAEYLAKLKTGG